MNTADAAAYRTPQSQVDTMKNLCRRLEQQDGIKQAFVDDWGRFGNFQLQVEPAIMDRHSTNRLTALVRKHLKGTGAHLREIFPPDRTYTKAWSRRDRLEKKATGWVRKTWLVDIDFHDYDPANNAFDLA